MIFSQNSRIGAFMQSEIRNQHATNFQNKMYIEYQKI